MTIEDRLAGLEKRLGKDDEMVRELRDAVTVTASLENRQGRPRKDQSEELALHAQWLKEHQIAMKVLDERIANLVSGVGEFMRRQ